MCEACIRTADKAVEMGIVQVDSPTRSKPMKYVLINPILRTAIGGRLRHPPRCGSRAAGLDPGKVDHGMISRSIGYVVL